MSTYQADQSYIDKGMAFQKFICEYFGLVDYKTASEQYDIGETKFGVEIKFDDILEMTGNLWIEIAEKRFTTNPDWIDSGINKNDNSWLYLIGNYNEAFCFSKKQLKSMLEMEMVEVRENKAATSKGFLLSKEKALSYCLTYWQF